MAALTEDRDSAWRTGDIYNFGVAATTKTYAGGIAVLNATGFAKPGTTATGETAVGRFENQVDNSAGADADLTVDVRAGRFKFGNSAAGDEITIANIGADCYIVDDQTVAATDGTGTRSAAGKVIDVDGGEVWVAVGVSLP